jgi:hypothetical protein
MAQIRIELIVIRLHRSGVMVRSFLSRVNCVLREALDPLVGSGQVVGNFGGLMALHIQ